MCQIRPYGPKVGPRTDPKTDRHCGAQVCRDGICFKAVVLKTVLVHHGCHHQGRATGVPRACHGRAMPASTRWAPNTRLWQFRVICKHSLRTYAALHHGISPSSPVLRPTDIPSPVSEPGECGLRSWYASQLTVVICQWHGAGPSRAGAAWMHAAPSPHRAGAAPRCDRVCAAQLRAPLRAPRAHTCGCMHGWPTTRAQVVRPCPLAPGAQARGERQRCRTSRLLEAQPWRIRPCPPRLARRRPAARPRVRHGLCSARPWAFTQQPGRPRMAACTHTPMHSRACMAKGSSSGSLLRRRAPYMRAPASRACPHWIIGCCTLA